MPNLIRTGVAAALLALAAGGCARQPVHEEQPHHFSRDTQGNRLACYTTDLASEYECVPVARRYPYGYADDPYYDPFWPHVSLGWYYGYGYGYPYPVYTPAPSYPSRPPPAWHRPRNK